MPFFCAIFDFDGRFNFCSSVLLSGDIDIDIVYSPPVSYSRSIAIVSQSVTRSALESETHMRRTGCRYRYKYPFRRYRYTVRESRVRIRDTQWSFVPELFNSIHENYHCKRAIQLVATRRQVLYKWREKANKVATKQLELKWGIEEGNASATAAVRGNRSSNEDGQRGATEWQTNGQKVRHHLLFITKLFRIPISDTLSVPRCVCVTCA